MAKNQHVVPHGEKWAVRNEDSPRVTSVFDSKQEAIDAARNLAQRFGSEYLVHGKNGQLLQGSEMRSRLSEEKIRSAVRDNVSTASRKLRSKS